MKTTILLLLFACHFLADFTHLSTNWMLSAKKLGKPFIPIICHAACHAALMYIVMLFFVDGLLAADLAMFQLITHFLIDLWKGRMNGWFPALQNPANKWHWILMGFDQYLHAIVIITMTTFM